MKYYDISVPYTAGMIQWPDNQPVKIKKLSSINSGNYCNESSLSINIHAGTHIDASYHFVKNGKSIDKIPLNRFTGPCYVTKKIKKNNITSGVLQSLNIPQQYKKILLKTENSDLWNSKNFNKSYTGLTPEGAEWLVKRKIELIGIDYVSIGKYDKTNITTHQKLLSKNIIVIEGLNLSKIKPGKYNIIAFPLNIINCEGAPARVVLTK